MDIMKEYVEDVQAFNIAGRFYRVVKGQPLKIMSKDLRFCYIAIKTNNIIGGYDVRFFDGHSNYSKWGSFENVKKMLNGTKGTFEWASFKNRPVLTLEVEHKKGVK